MVKIINKYKRTIVIARQSEIMAELQLKYHPFISNGRELIHPAMGIAIDRTALSFGIKL
jgi:hypothetical protein